MLYGLITIDITSQNAIVCEDSDRQDHLPGGGAIENVKASAL